MFRISSRVGYLALLPLVAALAACSSGAEPQQAPAGAGVTALTNARVIDGTGAPAMEGATILVRDGRIEAVGAGLAVPAGATTVDMSGKTIMPGMINAHGHAQKGINPNVAVRDDLIRQLRMSASYGVTTVVSLGANPDDEVEQIRLRDEQGTGALDRARIYTSGQSVRRFKTPEEARTDVNRVADLRPDVIKFHFDDPPNNMSEETWSAIIEESHKRGLRVAPHIFFLRDAKAAVDRGADVLAHSVRDVDVDQALIDAMRQREVGYIPTLTREVSVFVYESTPDFFSDPFFQRGMSLYKEHVDLVSTPEYQQKVRGDKVAQSIKQALVQAKRNLKLLSDGGVLIGFGTDGGVPNATTFGRFQGFFEHMELEEMVDAGLTPMQALTAATGNSARMMRLNDLGTIAPGKVADLLVLDANPLDDIRNTRQINSVWVGGQRLAPVSTN